MTTESLRLAISSPDAAQGDDRWVNLEQIISLGGEYNATIEDIYRMWNAAATGQTAQELRPTGCPITIVGTKVVVALGFNAWPSDPALIFQLTSALGELTERRQLTMYREFSAFMDNQSRFELPYYMQDVAIEWETATWDRYGSRIPIPTITIHPTWLEFSAEVFGCIRVRGNAIGVTCGCEMTLSKPITVEQISEEERRAQALRDLQGETMIISPPALTRLNSYKVENLENTITASWLNYKGETENDQLRLEIPQCVKDFLAMCPDMFATITAMCTEISTKQVYYSTCTGEIIAIYKDVDPRKYCIVEGQPNPYPNNVWVGQS